MPIIGPLIYSTSRLQSKASGTIRNQLQVLDSFYGYFDGKGFDLDKLLFNGEFQTVFQHLFEFLNKYLLDKDQAKNRTTSRSQLTFKSQVVKSYLDWSLSRYIQLEVNQLLKKDEIVQRFRVRLNYFFEPYSFSSDSSRKVYKSFSDEDYLALLKLVHPNSINNPFQEKERIRNYLIIQVLISSGIRLGELLTIQSASIKEMNNHFYLSIFRKQDIIDIRRNVPSIKNKQSERIISISEELYNLSTHYILNNRRPVKGGRKMKLSHGFLFTSSLGTPLSKSTVAHIFNSINNLQGLENGLSKRISPHMIRHTFCDKFLKYLIEVREMDMERAKDHLRAVCGWSPGSNMPTHYAGKYISLEANEHNINRILESHKRYEKSAVQSKTRCNL